MASRKKADGEKVRLIYVGPAIPDGRLKTNAVFLGTREEILASVETDIKEYPEAEKFFVTVDKAAAVKKKIGTPGNLYNKYNTMMKSLIEGRKGGRRCQ